MPWSPQGKLTKQSASLLSDSPASFERKFDSPHISFTADESVWDDGEMSFDMVTETDDGAVDEDVSLSLAHTAFSAL